MNKTIDQILIEIHQVKPCSRTMLYHYFNRYDIKPVGPKQRPQRYPADTAAKILGHLGLAGGESDIISVKEAKRRAGRGGK